MGQLKAEDQRRYQKFENKTEECCIILQERAPGTRSGEMQIGGGGVLAQNNRRPPVRD